MKESFNEILEQIRYILKNNLQCTPCKNCTDDSFCGFGYKCDERENYDKAISKFDKEIIDISCKVGEIKCIDDQIKNLKNKLNGLYEERNEIIDNVDILKDNDVLNKLLNID